MRGTIFTVLIIMLTAALSGCLHLNASMNISNDDKVSGEFLVSAQTVRGQEPFRLNPPPNLADRVHVTPYHSDGRSGSHLSFHDLSFDEVEQLGQALNPADSRYEFQLNRSGSLVTLNGRADLTPLSNTDSSVEVRVSAPGEITDTNGQESAGTVTWTLEPGEVTQVAATFQFASSTFGEWAGWAMALGAGTLTVALLVAFLALRTHLRTRAAPADYQ